MGPTPLCETYPQDNTLMLALVPNIIVFAQHMLRIVRSEILTSGFMVLSYKRCLISLKLLTQWRIVLLILGMSVILQLRDLLGSRLNVLDLFSY